MTTCRTIRLQLPLSRVHGISTGLPSSTRYMCPLAHFHAYGEEIDGRSCLEVVHQRVVVQVASCRLLIEWAISRGGRSQARGTCVRGIIFMRMERKSTVDRV